MSIIRWSEVTNNLSGQMLRYTTVAACNLFVLSHQDHSSVLGWGEPVSLHSPFCTSKINPFPAGMVENLCHNLNGVQASAQLGSPHGKGEGLYLSLGPRQHYVSRQPWKQFVVGRSVFDLIVLWRDLNIDFNRSIFH